MRKSLTCLMAVVFLSTVALAQTSDNWTLNERDLNQTPPNFLNQLLHAGGNHPTSHAEHTQARIRQPPDQPKVLIEFEWGGRPLPGPVSEQFTAPLETFEFD